MQPPETGVGLVSLVAEDLVIFGDLLFLSIMEGVFGYYCIGQIAAVCHRWHSVDGSGLPSSSGKAGWGALPGLAASQGWGPWRRSPRPHRQLGEPLPTATNHREQRDGRSKARLGVRHFAGSQPRHSHAGPHHSCHTREACG